MSRPWGIVLVVVACGLVACRKREAPIAADAGPTAAAGTSTAQVAVDAASVEPTTVEASASYAVFKGDALDECTDVAFSVPVSVGEAKVKEVVESTRKKIAPKGWAPVPSSCAEQFADRYVLASCRQENAEERDGGVVAFVILSHYYSVRTAVDSDAHMRSCMKDDGKWTAAKKDDHEAARERIRQRAKALQDLADKAGAQ